MATVRIGDFSGGTSEVLDPSLIAPNAAVASYNLDPRSGVFSPILGPSEGTATGSSYIEFIEYDGGHEPILAPQPRSYARWGDYLLWSYPNTGLNAYAARFDSATGARSELRDIGMDWTTEAENATVALRPIRAAALVFADGQHNLTGDIAANIEAARDVPALQYQFAEVFRYQVGIRGADGEPQINVAPGDWIVILPRESTEFDSGDIFVGRPGCVVEVFNSQVDLGPTTGESIPTATLVVSMFGRSERGITRRTTYGVESLYDGNPSFISDGLNVALFKRSTKTLRDVIDFARSMCSRAAADYIYPVLSDSVAQAYIRNAGGAAYTKTWFTYHATINCPLYDYTIYTLNAGGDKALLVGDNTYADPRDSAPGPYDMVSYYDNGPNSTDEGKVILGVQPASAGLASFGLSSGVYRYAFTRVDEWGRESAPWPYLLEDKDRPRIDATTEATASSTLGALFVGISGMPPVPAGWKLNVYRTRADGAQYFFHSKLDAAEDFVDTVSDFDLSVLPMLAEQNYPPLVVPVDEEAKVFTRQPLQFLSEFKGVLWGAYKNRLMFSAPGRFYAWPPGNYVLLPANITGVLPAGDVLLVFTRTATFRLTGNTFSTMDFRRVSDEYGCVAHRTACLVDRRPMWCSLNGIATFDGVRVQIVTDGILQDNSAQFIGASAACSYRGEYYLLLTPTVTTPTRARKGDPVATEIEPRQRYFLRVKPGEWVTHGLLTGAVTDIKPNPSDGKLYIVGGGQVRKMFDGPVMSGYWKSGRLHGGYKALRKNGLKWFAVVVGDDDARVRVQVEADGRTEVVDRYLAPGEHFIDFKAGVFFRDLSFAFTGDARVTEFGFEFKEGQAQ